MQIDFLDEAITSKHSFVKLDDDEFIYLFDYKLFLKYANFCNIIKDAFLQRRCMIVVADFILPT